MVSDELEELKNGRVQKIVAVTICNETVNYGVNNLLFNDMSVVLLVFLLNNLS